MNPENASCGAPRTFLEKCLTGIWSQLLEVDQVGIFDDFFRLGGDSLLAAQLVVILLQRFGFHMPLAALTQAPMIAQFTQRLSKPENGLAPSLIVALNPDGCQSPFF